MKEISRRKFFRNSAAVTAGCAVSKIRQLPEIQNLGHSDTAYTPEQEYLFKIFKTRRSVRKFKSTPVPSEHIMKILDMARCSSTAGNQQPWKFLVIQDREKLDKLRDECINRSLERAKNRPNYDPASLDELKERNTNYYTNYLSAPVYVVVLVDKNSRYPTYNIYDGSIAGGYLMIAARALGYGTVFSQDSIPYELIKKVFEIPDNFVRICFTPIGVPEEWPDSPDKKPLEKFIAMEKLIEGVNYEVPKQRKAIKLNPEILKNYTGKYEISPELFITVTVENDRIFVEVTGQQKTEIFPETETEFFVKVVDAQITFVKNEDGKVTELIIHQGGNDTPAKKVE